METKGKYGVKLEWCNELSFEKFFLKKVSVYKSNWEFLLLWLWFREGWVRRNDCNLCLCVANAWCFVWWWLDRVQRRRRRHDPSQLCRVHSQSRQYVHLTSLSSLSVLVFGVQTLVGTSLAERNGAELFWIINGCFFCMCWSVWKPRTIQKNIK